jgi:hypothetical protein
MRLIALALLLVLVPLSDASAGWRRERATAIAQIVWDHPCDDQVELRWQPIDGIHAAWFSGPCQITFATEFRQDWPGFCTTMIHEYGHVAGVWHNSNPRSVMYERPLPNWRCANNGRNYLHRHGKLL